MDVEERVVWSLKAWWTAAYGGPVYTDDTTLRVTVHVPGALYDVLTECCNFILVESNDFAMSASDAGGCYDFDSSDPDYYQCMCDEEFKRVPCSPVERPGAEEETWMSPFRPSVRNSTDARGFPQIVWTPGMMLDVSVGPTENLSVDRATCCPVDDVMSCWKSMTIPLNESVSICLRRRVSVQKAACCETVGSFADDTMVRCMEETLCVLNVRTC